MPKKIEIHITETLQELGSLKRKTTCRLKEDRLRALILIKQGSFCYQSNLARKLGYTDKTVRGWLKSYSKGGISAYLEIKSGGNAPSVVVPEAHNFMLGILSDTHGTVTSYVELAHLLEEQHQIKVNYMTLYGYCRRKFGSKLKVARKSHYKKDEQAIEAFKKTPFPDKTHKTKYKQR